MVHVTLRRVVAGTLSARAAPKHVTRQALCMRTRCGHDQLVMSDTIRDLIRFIDPSLSNYILQSSVPALSFTTSLLHDVRLDDSNRVESVDRVPVQERKPSEMVDLRRKIQDL